ncbi:TetR/AcrR family transcriptional regulator [Phreatobacter sp.]|uniref:TetR/AcrR family transcriptional regulator n=1 Tax=Phreatobacter sp. TaxID=1966341 RepID=UPI003F71A6EC
MRQTNKPGIGTQALAGSPTRSIIVEAADALFYERGLRSVSMDEIAERAGVTKRTLYYHFDSKDELIAAYLAARDLPTMQRYRQWLGGSDRPLPERVSAMFSRLAAHARKPKWLGCGFTRAAVELASQPGHPAVAMAARHKQRFETWLEEEFRLSGVEDPAAVARQVMILLEGAIALALVHRDAAYARSAGDAAAQIVGNAMTERGAGGSSSAALDAAAARRAYTD